MSHRNPYDVYTNRPSSLSKPRVDFGFPFEKDAERYYTHMLGLSTFSERWEYFQGENLSTHLVLLGVVRELDLPDYIMSLLGIVAPYRMMYLPNHWPPSEDVICSSAASYNGGLIVDAEAAAMKAGLARFYKLHPPNEDVIQCFVDGKPVATAEDKLRAFVKGLQASIFDLGFYPSRKYVMFPDYCFCPCSPTMNPWRKSLGIELIDDKLACKFGRGAFKTKSQLEQHLQMKSNC